MAHEPDNDGIYYNENYNENLCLQNVLHIHKAPCPDLQQQTSRNLTGHHVLRSSRKLICVPKTGQSASSGPTSMSLDFLLISAHAHNVLNWLRDYNTGI